MKIPQEGLIKLTTPPRADVSSSQRAALIRKGNELFNAGNLDMAKKIFLSVGYSDGIIRIGDALYKKADYLEAFRMYKIAPSPEKASFIVEKLAKIVQGWLAQSASSDAPEA